jgi:hypothetical protein
VVPAGRELGREGVVIPAVRRIAGAPLVVVTGNEVEMA